VTGAAGFIGMHTCLRLLGRGHEVLGIDMDAATPARLQLANGKQIAAENVVIAAGAWSGLLAHDIGDRVLLESERGYNTTLPAGAFDVRRQLVFPGHGFVVTSLSTGLRIGGAVELGGLDLPPNFKRSDVEFGPALAEALQFNGTNSAVGAVTPVVKTDTLSAMRVDGNNVDVDREATYLAQAQLQFSALMSVVTKNLTTMSSIITGAR